MTKKVGLLASGITWLSTSQVLKVALVICGFSSPRANGQRISGG